MLYAADVGLRKVPFAFPSRVTTPHVSRGRQAVTGSVRARSRSIVFPSRVTTPHVSEAVTGSVRARSRSIVARPARGTAPRALHTGRI